MRDGDSIDDERTVLTGIGYRIEIVRERLVSAPTNVIPLHKPPQSDWQTAWQSSTAWAGFDEAA